MAQQSTPSPDTSFLVKDVDGQFKVWHEGSLDSNGTTPTTQPTPAATPNYTEPATIPADIHFLPAPTVGANHDVAEFHFHPDDKADVEAELEKINTFLTTAAEKRKYSVEKIAAKIIEKNKLKFNPQQETQFISLLLSYFRQARSQVITKETMIQSLSLDPALVDKIMVIVKNLKDKIELADGVVVRGSAERAIDQEENPARPQPVEPIAVPEAPAPPVKVVMKPRVEPSPVMTQPETISSPATELPKVRRSVTIEPVKVSAPLRSARPAKVMSRIDELAAMTLEDFRQLDPDPRVRAAKILQRINNLESESLARKAQGVAAWRSSGVYQAYLAMGHHGLEHGKNLNQIAEAMKEQGQDYMSTDEFEAMTDLNKQLRF